MEISPYTSDRFDECVEIFVSNLDNYFADYELEEFKSYLNRVAGANTYFVALEAGEVVGCGGYDEYHGDIYLTWGMIRRDLHGKGFGRELTSYRLKAIEKIYPAHTVKIDTSQYTQDFYQKLGFKIQSVEKDGFKPGLDKVVMALELLPNP